MTNLLQLSLSKNGGRSPKWCFLGGAVLYMPIPGWYCFFSSRAPCEKSCGKKIYVCWGQNMLYLVGGIPTPLKNMSESVGLIIPNI